jgi:hypothetical protein
MPFHQDRFLLQCRCRGQSALSEYRTHNGRVVLRGLPTQLTGETPAET